MPYPKKPLAQTIIQLCKAKQIEHIVISPGSRNAPLTIGFSNDDFFECYSIVDERCAGFFALGIACVYAAIRYTMGETAYGYRALGDVMVFIFFGLLSVIGCYFLYARQLDHVLVLPACAIGMLSTCTCPYIQYTINNYIDKYIRNQCMSVSC